MQPQPPKRHILRNVLLTFTGLIVVLIIVSVAFSPKKTSTTVKTHTSPAVTASPAVHPSPSHAPALHHHTPAATAAASSSPVQPVPVQPVPVSTPVHASGCYPLTNAGHCCEPGEFCRGDDHGDTGMAGDGKSIRCENNDGWRWEPV